MSDKVSLGKLSTGVQGLDVLLGGGLSEFSFNLIAGPPGSGKTTLAHQMMFSLATTERRALFFTVLGEPPEIDPNLQDLDPRAQQASMMLMQAQAGQAPMMGGAPQAGDPLRASDAAPTTMPAMISASMPST